MIRPQVTQPEDDRSPIEVFAAIIALMGTHAKHLRGMVDSVSNWPVVLDDLEMIVSQGTRVMGLRSIWVRRTAVHILNARTTLEAKDGTDQDRARIALGHLRQIRDDGIARECIDWVKRKYHVE